MTVTILCKMFRLSRLSNPRTHRSRHRAPRIPLSVLLLLSKPLIPLDKNENEDHHQNAERSQLLEKMTDRTQFHLCTCSHMDRIALRARQTFFSSVRMLTSRVILYNSVTAYSSTPPAPMYSSYRSDSCFIVFLSGGNDLYASYKVSAISSPP